MVGIKGKSGGRRPNQTGRPPEHRDNKRHNISVSRDVWRWLNRNGERTASAEIERLAREAMRAEEG